MPYNKGVCEIIIAKNRNGKTGTAKVQFIPEHTKFQDFDTQNNQPTANEYSAQNIKNPAILPNKNFENEDEWQPF